MSLPDSQSIPEASQPLPTSHRRRERHTFPISGSDSDERAAFLNQLADRTVPTFFYFPMALLAGLVIGAGVLLDSPALAVLGAVLFPFMGPFLGLGLATIAGSGRFFLQSAAAAGIGAALAFAGGALANTASRYLPGAGLPPAAAALAAGFSWPGALALSLGVILTVSGFVRNSPRALLTGVVVTYLLFTPLVSAGQGLAAGDPAALQQGLIVFIVYLAWMVNLTAASLGILGLRPRGFFGAALGITIAAASLMVIIVIGGLGLKQPPGTPAPAVQPPISNTLPAALLPLPTSSPTLPAPVTPFPTATHTLIPTLTPTATVTPAPTPVWAIINAASYNGALIRSEPRFGSKILLSILNGSLVQVLPGASNDGTTTWVHVRTTDGIDGWIVQGLLVTATPVPGW